MTPSLVLVLIMAVLYATGVTIMLERSLSRIIIGFLLVGNATNLLIVIVAGPAGLAPLVQDPHDTGAMADPLPQGLILTAIVINFGLTAFLLALVHRSWRIARGERLQDEDALVPGSESHDTDESAEVFEQSHGDDTAMLDAIDESSTGAEDEQDEDDAQMGAPRSDGRPDDAHPSDPDEQAPIRAHDENEEDRS